MLKGLKIAVTTHKSNKLITNVDMRYVDLFVTHSSSVAALYAKKFNSKFTVVPYFINIKPKEFYFDEVLSRTPYIFCGGTKRRDFRSMLITAKDLPCEVKFIVSSVSQLGYWGHIPENCRIYENIPYEKYLELMANAYIVVVPLKPGNRMHGITNIVEAQWFGKPVISTLGASVDDYVVNGKTGYLVEPNNIAEYKNTILELLSNKDRYHSFAKEVELQKKRYSYNAFLDTFSEKISGLMDTNPAPKQGPLSSTELLRRVPIGFNVFEILAIKENLYKGVASIRLFINDIFKHFIRSSTRGKT